MKKPVVLIVDRDRSFAPSLTTRLDPHDWIVLEASSAAETIDALRRARPDLVLVVSPPGDAWGLEIASEASRWKATVLLLIGEDLDTMTIAELKPSPPGGVVEHVHALGAASRAASRTALTPVVSADSALIGESAIMREVRAAVARVAPTDSNVMITGETGTGKELVAQLVHRWSRRHAKRFVSINCAAIPETLLESELFGFEKGAFTGATTAYEGKLRLARGGTVFLDEIGDLSPHAQAKLLRAVETKEVHQLGGRDGVRLDVRLVAATNRDLEQMVGDERFRSDLYFRLNVNRLHLVPLRERKDDIPLLLDHFRRELNVRFERDIEGFTAEVTAALMQYPWPGNVRELKNALEAVFVNLPSGRVTVADLPERLRGSLAATANLPLAERERVLAALFATQWNKSRAARTLHWSRMTLYRKMAKYHIVGSGGHRHSA